MTVTEIRNILETPYDRKVWKGFIQTQFTNNKLFGNEQELLLNDNSLSNKCISLGNYEVDEFTKIGIFEVELSEKVNITRNRVALRNLIKEITKQVSGAMVVFVQGDKWRFSYISKRKVKNKETNQIEDKETAPKRYTYLFGKKEKALTAAIRFDKLIQKQKENIFQYLTLNDFEEAFSVEKLSKEFFKNYKDTYEDFVQFITGKRYGKKGNKYIEEIITEPNWQLTAIFNKDEKQARDFCKRMMGRIVFLYFIQKKGWLAVAQGKNWGEGNPNYLFDLFSNSKFKDDFYHLELVPLFFKTLNNDDSENEKNILRFPYLNGGLFDDSHDRKYNKLQLPEEIFNSLFETFNNYNFTIYEDAPDEHTVAVDPEMLGHIFENLLEDNKDKGAFYTPKEIVHYMCQESLQVYLFSHDEFNLANNDISKSTISKIIQQQELNSDERQFAEKNAYKIIDALEQVKICDPAIGSGAFPMGLLQEIFNAQIYLQELKGFKKGISDADIKKHIIEESIYGVDIDAGAVDISRLRFWLSLVVDEQMPQPLPNLNFKIVCANTLVPLGDLSDLDFNEKAGQAVIELGKLRHEFFSVSSDDKLRLERQFKKIQTDLLSSSELATKSNFEIYTKLYEFNPFEDTPCSWFDAWWMFGVKNSFDIVIGNPPYVQLQKDGGKLAKLYQPYKYETFERTGDIYSLFYERGMSLLNEKGILCFITSNKWMRANYGASTRQFFAEKTNPILLIDFGNVQVFETATVDTNILILQNKSKTKKNELKDLFAVRLTSEFNISDQSISDFIIRNGYYMPSLNHNSWVVGEKDIYNIKESIEKQGIPLNDSIWDLKINRGILTGLDEAFVIPNEIKEMLISKDEKNREILKPILRGKDIAAWHPDYKNLWLINSHNGLKSKGIEKINVKKDYPIIYKWLSDFEDKLKKRLDKGDDWTNLRNCAFLDEFQKPKVIYPNMTKFLPFVYDESGVFVNPKCYIMTGEHLKYLTCFLNSKLFKYCFSDNFPELQGGTREIHKVFFDKIPVKKIKEIEEIPFNKIVDYLVAFKKENSQEPTDQFMFIYFEQIANAMIFELYFKEEFDNRKLSVAKYIKELPVLSLNEKTLHQLRKIYVSISQDKHPLKEALFNMLTIPQIELIMNSN